MRIIVHYLNIIMRTDVDGDDGDVRYAGKAAAAATGGGRAACLHAQRGGSGMMVIIISSDGWRMPQ